MAVWEGELNRPEPSYTVDTLEALTGPGRRLTLLMGADQWARFHLWREPRRILEIARVGVLVRGGYEGPEKPEGAGPWPCVRVPVRRIEVSSTEIRSRVRTGRSARFLVPEGVRRIIEHHSLYGARTDRVAGAGARSI
jgi:nicotinate-nucleotide adenylyltransferase